MLRRVAIAVSDLRSRLDDLSKDAISANLTFICFIISQ